MHTELEGSPGCRTPFRADLPEHELVGRTQGGSHAFYDPSEGRVWGVQTGWSTYDSVLLMVLLEMMLLRTRPGCIDN